MKKFRVIFQHLYYNTLLNKFFNNFRREHPFFISEKFENEILLLLKKIQITDRVLITVFIRDELTKFRSFFHLDLNFKNFIL